MNLAHLTPEVETLFERLDDAGVRTACTPFLIYRGRHRHEVSLEGLLRARSRDAGQLPPPHLGPGRALLRRPLRQPRGPLQADLRVPGTRDGYSACCGRELVEDDLFDFLLFSLPDNDHYSHRHGPEASVESIAKADALLRRARRGGRRARPLPRATTR